MANSPTTGSALPRVTLRWQDSVVLGHLSSLAGLFPLTLQGTITLLVAATALSVFGYGRMDLVVFALAICALSILVFCLFCAVISGVLVQRRIHKSLTASGQAARAMNAEAGFPNESGFTLPALNYFPLIKLTWHIQYPDNVATRIHVGEEDELVEEIIPQMRCLTEQVQRKFTVSDVLGFCRYSWIQKQSMHCQVLPRTNTIRSLPILRSLTAEDGIPNPSGEPQGDRMEIRRYAAGDSVRNIMWKVYARNRQLNVRLPERSVFQSQRTVAYLLSSPKDEAAAAVARLALEKGALGEEWQFGADGSTQICADLPQAMRAIAGSRALGGEQLVYGLDEFLNRTGSHGGVQCVLFAGADSAPWKTALKSTSARLGGKISLVLATDGLHDNVPVKWWQKALFKPTGGRFGTVDRGTGKAELLGLLTDVGQLVESIVIVDRETGLGYDSQLRKL